MTIGRIFNAWLVAKFRTTTLIQILCIISILGLASNYFEFMRIFALPLIIIIGLGLSGIWPLLVGEAGTQFSQKYSGTAFGFAIAAGGIGSMVIPFAFGFFSASYSMSTLISMLSFFMLLIMVVYLSVEKFARQT
jgi:fucose permease